MLVSFISLITAIALILMTIVEVFVSNPYYGFAVILLLVLRYSYDYDNCLIKASALELQQRSGRWPSCHCGRDAPNGLPGAWA